MRHQRRRSLGLSVGLASALMIFLRGLIPFRVGPPLSPHPFFPQVRSLRWSLHLRPQRLLYDGQGLFFHMVLYGSDALGRFAWRARVDVKVAGRVRCCVPFVSFLFVFLFALAFVLSHIPSAQDDADTVRRLRTRGWHYQCTA